MFLIMGAIISLNGWSRAENIIYSSHPYDGKYSLDSYSRAENIIYSSHSYVVNFFSINFFRLKSTNLLVQPIPIYSVGKGVKESKTRNVAMGIRNSTQYEMVSQHIYVHLRGIIASLSKY